MTVTSNTSPPPAPPLPPLPPNPEKNKEMIVKIFWIYFFPNEKLDWVAFSIFRYIAKNGWKIHLNISKSIDSNPNGNLTSIWRTGDDRGRRSRFGRRRQRRRQLRRRRRRWKSKRRWLRSCGRPPRRLGVCESKTQMTLRSSRWKESGTGVF